MRFQTTRPFPDIRASIRRTGQTLFLKQKQLPRSWQISIAIFLAGRVLFSLWGWVIWSMRLMPTYKGPYYYDIDPVLEGFAGAFLGMWQRWDGIYYQSIATFGYVNDTLSAFFPLFPMLGRLVSFLFNGNALLGLIIVGNAAFLIALWLFYRIVCEEYSPDLAVKTLFCLIIFPTSFFFYSIYPQSLLLMFILLSYWLARHDQWVWAGLAGLAAGLTHSTAIVLTLLLGIEAGRSLLQKKAGNRPAAAIAPFMNLVGFGGFMVWRHFAGFPPYQVIQNELWGRSIAMPWEGLVAVGKFILTLQLNLSYLIPWIYVFIFFIIVGLTLWFFRKIPLQMWFFQAALIGIILCTPMDNDPLLGILRYPLVMFPIYIELAMLVSTKSRRLLMFSVFVLLGLICSALFFMWKSGTS